jgi:hypothetical protein
MWLSLEELLGNTAAAPWQAAAIVGAILIPLAAVSAWSLRETYGRDLDFVDE